MLFKITGSLIVILSCTFLGFVLSADCRKRPQQLRDLQSMLQMFENQISYLSDVITEAFMRIGKVCRSETGIFFTGTVEILNEGRNISACMAWEQAVRQNIKKTALNKEDEEILFTFGKMLGCTDLEGQIKNIRLALDQLKHQEVKAEVSRNRNEKMYRSLGVLGGIAVVIVLM
jgi:stage III sporulation protein AB